MWTEGAGPELGTSGPPNVRSAGGEVGGSPARSAACFCPSCCPTRLGCSGQLREFGFRQNRSGLRCCPCSCLLCCGWNPGWWKGFIGWNKVGTEGAGDVFTEILGTCFSGFWPSFLECEVVLNASLMFFCFPQTGNPALTYELKKIMAICLFWSNCCSLTHTTFLLGPEPYVCVFASCSDSIFWNCRRSCWSSEFSFHSVLVVVIEAASLQRKAKCILLFCCGCQLFTSTLEVKGILVMINQLHSKHLTLHTHLHTAPNPHFKRVRMLLQGSFQY